MLARNALVRLSNRKVLQVQGVDAARFLQGIVTNDMKVLTKPQDAMYGAFLTTKGRVLGDCHIVQLENETYLLDYDESVEQELAKHWKRYKIRMKATLEDKTNEFTSVAALPALISGDDFSYLPVGDEVENLLQQNTREPSASTGVVYRDPRGVEFGVRAIIPSNHTLNLPESYQEASLPVYKDRRVLLGAAEGQELHDSIPLEASLELLHGVSFRKGCYVGQELVARTQFKGNVRKRFLPVAFIRSAEQDLVLELSQIPFQRLDAAGLTPLRKFLVTDGATHPFSIEHGTSIVRPDSTKSVASVISAGEGVPVAVAMVRLEHLLPKESGEVPSMQFATADGAYHVVPFQPTWWPAVDIKTGKMVL
ncbi:hypothetical protein Poli38472_005500 [Pythium oligandrum]|uniref:GCVT N-terminal domain-containing protein n=1 Tax=Pythium oligandrum TaxID=41045 RepID=A0A8K1FKJ2_PYTOL|nr:hypothetical protein Poli38472_005500 [Pythium oligandrum]|eukprot:TMW62882.1 hypothetical protein Poli38472_005500 [Pythium oligandrum]